MVYYQVGVISLFNDLTLIRIAGWYRYIYYTTGCYAYDGWYREDTLRSGYLYQIYAYLRSQVGRGDALADCASGLLLHPSVGDTVDETVAIQGHSIRFATVDLTASPGEIRTQLLRLCETA